VLVAGCREGACAYRLGQRWTAERLARVREPRLRQQVPEHGLGVVWADVGDEAALAAALDELRWQTAGAAAGFEEMAS